MNTEIHRFEIVDHDQVSCSNVGLWKSYMYGEFNHTITFDQG